MFTECFLCVDLVPHVLHVVSHLLLKTNLWRKHSYCSHFTEHRGGTEKWSILLINGSLDLNSNNNLPGIQALPIYLMLQLSLFSFCFGQKLGRCLIVQSAHVLGHVKGATLSSWKRVMSKLFLQENSLIGAFYKDSAWRIIWKYHAFVLSQ